MSYLGEVDGFRELAPGTLALGVPVVGEVMLMRANFEGFEDGKYGAAR